MFKKKKVVSFLISGRGSNFSAVAEKLIKGEIRAKQGVVISNKENVSGLAKAAKYGFAAETVLRNQFKNKTDFELELVKILDSYKTDLVVAAGFMLLLSPVFIRAFENRIINIHPSLLPAFPGRDAQKQALDYGAKITGCTCHFIDEGVDTGPVILQAPVSIEDRDDYASLSKKILKEEHRILAESVKMFCEGRINIIDRKVFIN